MIRRLRLVKFIALLSVLFLLGTGCKKSDNGQDNNGGPVIKPKISGHIQKGPFVNGTTITMAELNNSLDQTGKNFTAQIINNSGLFELSNVSLSKGYALLTASGYYFDEVKGAISVAPLTLNALSDVTNMTTVNVNLITNLEKARVEYLVKQKGTSFTDAKKQAQAEVLNIFGFKLNEMDRSESLDISANNEGNAILLAISVILQGNQSVGALTEMLANISNDISQDGVLNNPTLLSALRTTALNLNLASIRSNLETRYRELGIQASIPDFEKYVNAFLVSSGKKPDAVTKAATSVLLTTATLNAQVNANSLSTTVTFEYGPTTSYGTTVNGTPPTVTGGNITDVKADLTGLNGSVTYHFRVKAVNSMGTTYGDDMTFTAGLSIGSEYQGGKIAYIYQPGDPGYVAGTPHGIIVAPTDQSIAAIWVARYAYLSTTQVTLGSGRDNTTKIITFQNDTVHTNNNYGAKICDDLVLNSYSDWYLPSKEELNKIYINRAAIGGLNGFPYWCSSAHGDATAWILDSSGTWQWANVFNQNGVRAIRYF